MRGNAGIRARPRLLVDTRRALGEEHTRKIAQLHHLLLELIPGWGEEISARRASQALLASVRPGDVVGKITDD